MARYIMAVHSNARPGRDAEYLAWYRDVHVPQICTIAGVVSGEVYEASASSPVAPPTRYVAHYHLELDDPTTVLKEIGRMSQAGELDRSDAVDPTSSQIMFFRRSF